MCTDDTVYSVTIVTDPSKGPFKLEQSVQLSCLVEPTPPEPVTYQFTVGPLCRGFRGFPYNSQKIYIHYYYSNLSYCWFFVKFFRIRHL